MDTFMLVLSGASPDCSARAHKTHHTASDPPIRREIQSRTERENSVRPFFSSAEGPLILLKKKYNRQIYS